MNISFKNQVVMVTGGTSGIGKASALAFAKAGAKVAVSGRREAAGREVVAEIQAEGGESIFVQADVTREAEVKALVEKTLETYGRLDVAFNNAGLEWAGPITDATEEDYRRVFDTNVWSVVVGMKYEIPAMLKTGGGAIINTSSVAGHIGMSGASLYIASKHAVEGLTKSAALEFAQQGLRINAVSPAVIETDMVQRFTGGNEDVLNHMRGLHPIGRSGQPREVAEPVLFLASESASFITGTSLVIDGGWLAH
jgi:NAD(P)-dependent dehydrogenase (short-subunit alcohol dehydrogenase family)